LRIVSITMTVARHTKKDSAGVDFVTETCIHHKIRRWVHKACYNADTDSYVYSTHLPRDALVHTTKHSHTFKNCQICLHFEPSGSSIWQCSCTSKTLKVLDLSHQASREAKRCYDRSKYCFLFEEIAGRWTEIIHKLAKGYPQVIHYFVRNWWITPFSQCIK
jgi:hypothetical protein